MVLQYVRTQGRITRSEVAELCRLSLDQAKRPLLRMVEEGQSAQQGYRQSHILRACIEYTGVPVTECGCARIIEFCWGGRAGGHEMPTVLTDAHLGKEGLARIITGYLHIIASHMETLRYDGKLHRICVVRTDGNGGVRTVCQDSLTV